MYGLDRATRSIGCDGEPGRLLREALLCALRAQLRSIGSKLASVERDGRPGRKSRRDRRLDEFLGAAGGALAYQGGAALQPCRSRRCRFATRSSRPTPASAA